ncbi:unnamed protein product [Adineta steineri]|uniref:Uncharacterized protein n=1 Tax=Adineta steineri TaxID=433720 RepID=A0A818VDK4_9BILA|nr:unnamed protein product [Adineta steineri]
MAGIAYFFKPKISAADSTTPSSTEKRPGRRSKTIKSSETPLIIEKPVESMETDDNVTETKIINEDPLDNPPTQTPKIKLKFNLRSKSVQDTSDDPHITNITNETNQSSDNNDDNDESSDNEIPLKIDDNNATFEEQDSPIPTKEDESPMTIVSPTKKKQQSSRKKVISHLIGTTANTLSFDEPSPIKIPFNDSQFSEVKQTKSGRTIKYTPYFKELVQGATISPPSSPVHTTSHSKRPSTYTKKKQSSIKADLDAIKNGGLPTAVNAKGRKSAGSPKNKKQTTSPVKRVGQGRKSTTPKNVSNAKSKRASNQMVMDEDVESDDENEQSQLRSDDEEFRHEGQSSEEDEEVLDADEDHSTEVDTDEEEWTTVGIKHEHDRSLGLTTTLGSISSEMLDGFSLWAMKYRARHRTMTLDDKRLYRTWKKMSAHDRQRWCLKAEKENYHYPITAELLKASSTGTEPTTSISTTKQTKSTKRKKGIDEHPPILLQKTLNQYSRQQPLVSAIRPPNAFVKQPTVVAPPKNYDIIDIAAGIYLLGESLTKMGEKVRQLGHLNPRGTSAATSIDNLAAILFDGTLCACNLMACLGNEITSTNPSTSKSDPLTNKLMENVGIILPGLN